jgi:hypothetical protein
MSDRDGMALYRSYRAHTNPTLIAAGEIHQYLVEVFPVGHAVPPGPPDRGEGSRPTAR